MSIEKEEIVDSLGLHPIDDIDVYFEESNGTENKWQPLSQFVVDFDFLKGIKNLTQKEIAKKMGTTQSAVSRVLSMKGKPSYEVLRKMSLAVGGSLFISPMGDYSITVPYELQQEIGQLAEKKSVSVKELVTDYLHLIVENEIHEASSTEQVNDISHNDNTLNFFALRVSTDDNDVDANFCREE